MKHQDQLLPSGLTVWIKLAKKNAYLCRLCDVEEGLEGLSAHARTTQHKESVARMTKRVSRE